MDELPEDVQEELDDEFEEMITDLALEDDDYYQEQQDYRDLISG